MPGGDHCSSCTVFKKTKKKTKNWNQRKCAAQVQEGQGCTPEHPSVPLPLCCVPGVNSARTLHLFCPHWCPQPIGWAAHDESWQDKCCSNQSLKNSQNLLSGPPCLIPHQRNRTPATWLTFPSIESWEIGAASCICSAQGNKTAHVQSYLMSIFTALPFLT